MVQDDKALLLRLQRVLSLNAAIGAKEAAGRPRDLEAARQLRAIKERTSLQ